MKSCFWSKKWMCAFIRRPSIWYNVLFSVTIVPLELTTQCSRSPFNLWNDHNAVFVNPGPVWMNTSVLAGLEDRWTWCSSSRPLVLSHIIKIISYLLPPTGREENSFFLLLELWRSIILPVMLTGYYFAGMLETISNPLACAVPSTY